MNSHEQTQAQLKASPSTHETPKALENEDEDQKPSNVYDGRELTSTKLSMKGDVKKEGHITEKMVYSEVYAPGYRFVPSDDELIVHYLRKKVMNEPMPYNKIKEVNLYRHNPQKLSEAYDHFGENEWYFFTPRDRKYRNGSRPNRAAGTGYWKATGADKPVYYSGNIVGYRKALVFYDGKPPKGDKSNWIMHEFRVNQPSPKRKSSDDMRLDDWVLCRIYKKADKYIRTQRQGGDRDRVDYPSDISEESNPKDMILSGTADDHIGVEHSHELIPRFGDNCIAPTFQNVVPEVPLLEHPSLSSGKLINYDDISGGLHFAGPSPVYPQVFPRENHVFRTTTKYSYVEDVCLASFETFPSMHFDYTNPCPNLIDPSVSFDNMFVDAVPDDPSDNQLLPRKR